MPIGIYDRNKSKPRTRERFFHDKKWLENQYLVLGKSTTEISRELGMRVSSLNYWFIKYQIPLRNRFKASNEKRSRMKKDGSLLRVGVTRKYLEKNYLTHKKTVNQIASEFGTSWDTIRRRIIRWGMLMREKDLKGIPKRKSNETRYFQKIILRHYGYKCAICGYNKFVNCCHLDRRAYGGQDKVENGIVLCPNHHYELDYGLISSDEIKKYQVNKEKVRHSK